ncbi:hypothetical protein ILUMI_12370 [Ignelater luminosus]|uniref:Gustatory receptor n=1 Tax=Ignelater luminosus TaxID=2038154 RepID=A0A8K0GD07_IGNLU|nr:hypothetical protein ILUMI_12370 [Ignelater luminosus]
MWAVVKLGVLFHLTYTCNQTKNEAIKSTVIIHQIQNRYKNDIIDEIIAFSKQVLHWNFRFTAHDLFDIDMSTFYLMLTSAATYLIILIQMDIAVKQNFKFSFSNTTFRIGK